MAKARVSVFKASGKAYHLSQQRLDKRRHRRPLRQHNQGAEQQQHGDNLQEPELIAFLHEGPQCYDKLA